MADRMGPCYRKIEIVFQSIEQRRWQVQMHCFGDRRSYCNLLANSGRTQPDRASFWRRLVMKSRSTSPYKTVAVSGNNQTNFHVLRNDPLCFTDVVKPQLLGHCGPAKFCG